MYIYRAKSINNPLYIHFLCGNKYVKKSSSDKRNVLKNYLDKKNNNYALILEKLFDPREYEDMEFKDLEEVELMASHYAKSIIIIHETVSTAAEIALFGSKEELKNKILVIYAPKNNVKIDTVGSFLKLAYFKKDKVKKVAHTFRRSFNSISERKYQDIKSSDETTIIEKIGYYNTFFIDDRLNDSIINEIDTFLSNIIDDFNIELKKKIANVNFKNTYEFSENKVNVTLSYHFIMSFVICVLINQDIIRDKREKNLCVKCICKFFLEVLRSTIEEKEIINLSNYKIYVKTPDNKDINLPVRFCIYLLDKIGFISFQNETLQVKNDFKNKFKEYKDLIILKNEPNFFSEEGEI